MPTPLAITGLELGAGAIFLGLLAPWVPHTGVALPLPDVHDALLLLILAYACTMLPFTLSLDALRHLSAFSVQMVINLEPVYAIVLAILILHEQHQLDVKFYTGVVLILGAVFAQPLLWRSHQEARS